MIIYIIRIENRLKDTFNEYVCEEIFCLKTNNKYNMLLCLIDGSKIKFKVKHEDTISITII